MTSRLGRLAKQTLRNYVAEIEPRLANYWQRELSLNFGFNKRQKEVVRGMLAHSREHNLRKSKRIRGSFVNYAFLLGKGKIDERIWGAAMAVELVHTALLMHDDFMDRDEVRRGGPTTHKFYADKAGGDKHYGETMAVGVGDAVLCLGFELLQRSGFEDKKVIEAMNQMQRKIAITAFGQGYDVTLEVEKKWTEDDVLSLHRAKTGVYTYENPLMIGAILGGLSVEAKKILTEYAMDGGVAFQLQDDILGVFGSEGETGKSADSDLKQGKCTLLVLKATELGSDEQKKAVKGVWGKMGAKRRELDLAKKAIKESGALEYNRELARKLASRAVRTAERLRGLNLNKKAIDYIQGVAEYMVEREV